MPNNHFVYFLNSNGEYERKVINTRDDHLSSGAIDNDNQQQMRTVSNENPDYPRQNYLMKQYIDEYVSNDVWRINGIENNIKLGDWQDGFSESMKSSQWNDHRLNNNREAKWGEFTQKGNPWI